VNGARPHTGSIEEQHHSIVLRERFISFAYVRRSSLLISGNVVVVDTFAYTMGIVVVVVDGSKEYPPTRVCLIATAGERSEHTVNTRVSSR